MARRKVYIPEEIVSQLCEIVRSEKYVALNHVFPTEIADGCDYLDLSLGDAQNLLRVVDAEMLKAGLRYPHNEEDDPEYDPDHDEKYDDIMLGLYEKTYYYVQAVFGEVSH